MDFESKRGSSALAIFVASALGFAGFVAASGPSRAQTPREAQTNAGVLTCTVAQAGARAGNARPVQCRFISLTDKEYTLTGAIESAAYDRLSPAKHVSAWSVKATEADLSGADLEGRYMVSAVPKMPATAVKVGADGNKAGGDETVMLNARGTAIDAPDVPLEYEMRLNVTRTRA